jgi:hypothetical protein
MSITKYGQIVAMVALPIFAGCQTGASSPAPVAMAKVDQAKPQPTAAPRPPVTEVVAKAEAKAARDDKPGPKEHTAFFRADAKPAAIPKVIMSKGDQAACNV